jgi:hypothetical protein
MIIFAALLNAIPFFRSTAALWCLIPAHLECPDMNASALEKLNLLPHPSCDKNGGRRIRAKDRFRARLFLIISADLRLSESSLLPVARGRPRTAE